MNLRIAQASKEGKIQSQNLIAASDTKVVINANNNNNKLNSIAVPSFNQGD